MTPWRLAALLLLAGCAARPVTPVQMAQPGDSGLDCGALDTQIKANAIKAAELLGKDKEVEDANTGKVIASFIFSGLIGLSVDLTREEQIVMRSLQDRNQRLDALSRQKGCATS